MTKISSGHIWMFINEASQICKEAHYNQHESTINQIVYKLNGNMLFWLKYQLDANCKQKEVIWRIRIAINESTPCGEYCYYQNLVFKLISTLILCELFLNQHVITPEKQNIFLIFILNFAQISRSYFSGILQRKLFS